jgi:hypothetical protein
MEKETKEAEVVRVCREAAETLKTKCLGYQVEPKTEVKPEAKP